MLNLSKVNKIFIEEQVFLEKDFYKQIRLLVDEASQKNYDLKIYVDNNINNKISDLLTSKLTHEAYLLDGILDILGQFNMIEYIETNSYLYYDELNDKLVGDKDDTRIIITQRESVYKSFEPLKNDFDNLNFLKFDGGLFTEWKHNQINTVDAFYLENDDYYISKIDTEDIEYVYSPRFGYLKLDIDSKMSGGEGSVYRTYNNMMVKIYKKDNITYTNYLKLSRMLELKVYNPFICWPKDLVFYENKFVGYLMDEVKGAKTLLSLRLESFKQYSHVERFKICYNFLQNIKYLHDKGIIIGDLKPDNILVKNENEVYFIDCGCYQIDDYSCPVCHPEYTKRVFAKDELKKQLRTYEDEYYPINKIAFEIMIMKNHTYSPTTQEVEDTDKTKFYYPLDLSTITQKSEDLTIWSNLSSKMREYYYYYFKQGKITELNEWTNELKVFLQKLNRGGN